MSIEIFLQARMGSSRLPGKVLKTVLGRPLLAYQIERLREVKQADSLLLLTTRQPEDDRLAAFCKQEGVECFRGAEADVLDRFFQAAQARGTELIIRSTADCPLIDPEIIDRGIELFQSAAPPCDYLSNSLERTFPRGLDFELFTAAALKKAWQEALDPWEREHVTPYLYHHPAQFKLQNLAHTPSLSHHRWTVDTEEDFTLISKMLEAIYPLSPRFRLRDLLELSDSHPDWRLINAHIPQKAAPQKVEVES